MVNISQAKAIYVKNRHKKFRKVSKEEVLTDLIKFQSGEGISAMRKYIKSRIKKFSRDLEADTEDILQEANKIILVQANNGSIMYDSFENYYFGIVNNLVKKFIAESIKKQNKIEFQNHYNNKTFNHISPALAEAVGLDEDNAYGEDSFQDKTFLKPGNALPSDYIDYDYCMMVHNKMELEEVLDKIDKGLSEIAMNDSDDLFLKSVFWLKFFDDYKINEMPEVLECSISEVRNAIKRIYRVLKKLGYKN